MATFPPYSMERTVRGHDCGYGGPLRVLPLINYFHEAAWHHAITLGLGIGHLQDVGRTWMLSRLEVRIDAPPHAGDRVTVTTWPTGLERIFAMRDFAMHAADGRTLARAVYAYLIVDLATRRPVRPDRHVDGDWPTSDVPHAIERFDLKVPRAETLTPAFSQQVMSRHLDDNGHANNVHLVGWLADAVPRDLRAAGTPSVVRVEFLREVLEGEVVEAVWEVSGAGVVTELRRGTDVVARAYTEWP
jgi:acyl-ACP thioesterase